MLCEVCINYGGTRGQRVIDAIEKSVDSDAVVDSNEDDEEVPKDPSQYELKKHLTEEIEEQIKVPRTKQ